MSRSITSAVLDEIVKDSTQLVHLVDVIFDDESIYVSTAFKNIDYNGQTYIPLGHLIQFDSVDETTNMVVNDANIILSGVDQSYFSRFLSKEYINRPIRVYLAVLDASNDLILDPIKILDGNMDRPVIDDDPETGKSVLSVRGVNHWADFNKVNGRFTNNESQQFYFAGDLGFNYSSELEQIIYWGRPTPPGAGE